MKKFKYSLETVYQFKLQVLDKVKEEYAIKQQEVLNQQSLINRLQEELFHYEEEFERVKQEGASIETIMMYVNGIERMEKRIGKEKDELIRRTVIAEEKKREVIKANVDTNAFEKLKEKKLEEYRVQGQKAEEQFIEEFVSHAMKA
ncbi:MAG: flagellar export protein FliJ [Oribacterium parvum]|uniref:Flagellar FliJ protein n=2 Tax=Oribacterium TaxID=265975 RepID=A0A7W9W1P7_9FIRM|nr:flagellar export protein FliJ [Oribacterium sinus]MBB6040668.1 flagellar export protein FliJ [Oribacterium sinus]MBF1283068.1 flagellar export protein FliJ [Oribacterium parvum]MBF1304696.1 flagellar export protein FliJ [Oribacterium sinus]